MELLFAYIRICGAYYARRGDVMKELKSWSIIGAVFSAGAGVLLHFVYEIFGGSVWAALGGVNESTWEHLKLLFWPVVVFMALEFAVYGRQTYMFLTARLAGLLAGMASIVIFFYTYSGILGYNISAINIMLFFVGVTVSYLVPLMMCRHTDGKVCGNPSDRIAGIAAAAGFVVMAVLFIIFTEYPPQLGLFQDPVTGRFGIY